MKRITLIVLANLFFGLACSLAQVQNLTVEPNHSTIGFKVPIAGGMTLVYGRFSEFDLKLSLIDGDWTKLGASFIIQAGSIDTEVAAITPYGARASSGSGGVTSRKRAASRAASVLRSSPR